MIAIILAAGVGSRIRPLTDNCPKCLLKVGGKTIIERMLANIQDCGIRDVVVVLGYLERQIKEYLADGFPGLNIEFVVNENYSTTNTGYSLMLAKGLVADSAFLKFDADVVFNRQILTELIDCEYASCLCIDRGVHLDVEEIKVVLGDDSKVIKASKEVDPNEAVGESIGIEKISRETAKALFAELENMMVDQKNYQQYYENAYERLIEQGFEFGALDISGKAWVEIDTREDLIRAESIFGNT